MSILPKFYQEHSSVSQYIAMCQDINGADHIKALNQHITPKATVLELGSGPGNDFLLLSENLKVTGSDLSDEFITRLKKRFPHGVFLKLDASTIETNQNFEAIYSNKVLHHLTDEELKMSLSRQSELLEKKGIICHTFWKGNDTENFNDMLVNNHTAEKLTTLLSEKFDIVHLSLYTEFDDDDSILLIARKR